MQSFKWRLPSRRRGSGAYAKQAEAERKRWKRRESRAMGHRIRHSEHTQNDTNTYKYYLGIIIYDSKQSGVI